MDANILFRNKLVKIQIFQSVTKIRTKIRPLQKQQEIINVFKN